MVHCSGNLGFEGADMKIVPGGIQAETVSIACEGAGSHRLNRTYNLSVEHSNTSPRYSNKQAVASPALSS